MPTITTWTEGLLAGLAAGLSRFFSAIPNIIGALLILVVGWIIAGWLGTLVTNFARAIHVDTVGDRVGAHAFLERSGTTLRSSHIFGEIVKWVVRLVFVEMAAEQLGMTQVTQIINQILAFVPNIVVAIVILGVGAFVGQIVGGLVRGFFSEANIGNPEMFAKLANAAVIAFAVIAALNELQIAPIVVNTLYIGLVATLAIAIGLAFGLGGRDTAARLTDRWVRQAESVAQKSTAPTTTGTVPPTAAQSPASYR